MNRLLAIADPGPDYTTHWINIPRIVIRLNKRVDPLWRAVDNANHDLGMLPQALHRFGMEDVCGVHPDVPAHHGEDFMTLASFSFAPAC